MSAVSSLSGGGGTPLTGAIGIVSNSGALTVGQNTTAPANNITLVYNPNGITAFTAGGAPAAGNITLDAGNGLSYTNDGFGTVSLNTFSPSTGTATAAAMVAQNLGAALAWAGSAATPPISTVAYVPGAVVIYSGTTFVCLVAQPVGSALPVNGANWQSIGGGGGSGGSSITGGGATVACDSPSAGTGSITLTTTATGTDGSIIIDTTAAASGDIDISTEGNVDINTTSNGGAGARITTLTTASLFEATSIGGVAGQISFISGDATHPSNVAIGGTPTATGLYVSNTQLLFNNVPVGSGSTPTEILQAGASVAVGAGGGITATTTGSDDFIVNTRVGTASGNLLLSANGANTFGTANVSIQGAATGTLTMGGTSGGGQEILLKEGGAALVMDNLGSLSYTTSDVASNENKITLTTIVPTTTPGVDAGHITITSGGSLSLSTGDTTGNLDITNPAGTIQVSLGASSYMNVDVAPGTGYAQGTVPFYNVSGVWNNTSGYGRGCIVAIGSLTAPTAFFICILAVAPAVSPAVNPAPSANPTNWLPFGGGGSGGNPMTLSTAAGAVWSGALGYAVGEVVNQPSPPGIFVCIQTIPVPTPPATNPLPSISPLFWVELLGSTTTPGGAMVYTSPFNNAIAYVAQSLVPDPGGGDYVCILPTTAPIAPAVNPNPSADPTHWALVSGGMLYQGEWANAGAPPTYTPPNPLVAYKTQEVITTPNVPPTGLLYQTSWVAGTTYNITDKVFFATSASVPALTNWICIGSASGSTPPYSDPTNWLDVGTTEVSNGIYAWGTANAINITPSSGYPLNNADFQTLGFGNTVLTVDSVFNPGKYLFPPFPTVGARTINWATSESGVIKPISELCPMSPLFFKTWEQPIRVCGSLSIQQSTAGAAGEIYLTVGLYGADTPAAISFSVVPLGQLVPAGGFMRVITQDTFSFQPVLQQPINFDFEALVGNYPATPSASGTLQYFGLYAQLQFPAGGVYSIFFDSTPRVVSYNGTGYWQFSPRNANNFTNN